VINASRDRLAALHWPLLLTVLTVAGLGCYNLHSAAAGHLAPLYLTQLCWLGLGCVVCLLVLCVDYRVTESVAYVLYGITCALLLTVLLAGKQSMGARRWLVLGGIAWQPSEIAKITTVLCLARYFSRRLPTQGFTLTQLVRPLNPSRPLIFGLWLARHWQRPALADPVGTLARALRQKLAGEAPPLENLLWFRGMLLALLAVGGLSLGLWVVRAERAASLLHPWPKRRRQRILWMLVGVVLSLGAVLAFLWQAPGLGDPVGLLIARLNEQAGPGGPYESMQHGLFLRLLLGGFFAAYLVASVVSTLMHRGPWVDLLVAPMDLLAFPAVLTLVQPDLGTAGILVLIGMTMVLVVGIRLRSLIILGFATALIFTVAWFGVLKDYQKRRILTFIDPEQDVRGAGWNAVQSLIAVGSGQWFGKGHLGGTQTQLSFLPEQHTDFAFSVWAEEQGFVGSALLLLLYLLMLTLSFAVAAAARDVYGALLATGVASLILWQVVINVGMVIGVLPVVGLTLPLFSYGGSSMLTLMLGVGLLLNVHWRRRVF
jgi:cell division protein FtsW (lipid II flippase)